MESGPVLPGLAARSQGLGLYPNSTGSPRQGLKQEKQHDLVGARSIMALAAEERIDRLAGPIWSTQHVWKQLGVCPSRRLP